MALNSSSGLDLLTDTRLTLYFTKQLATWVRYKKIRKSRAPSILIVHIFIWSFHNPGHCHSLFVEGRRSGLARCLWSLGCNRREHEMTREMSTHSMSLPVCNFCGSWFRVRRSWGRQTPIRRYTKTKRVISAEASKHAYGMRAVPEQGMSIRRGGIGVTFLLNFCLEPNYVELTNCEYEKQNSRCNTWYDHLRKISDFICHGVSWRNSWTYVPLTYQSEHLLMWANSSVMIFDWPSRPGASGILFLSWGIDIRIAPVETRYLKRGLLPEVCRASRTCPTVTWVRSQLMVKRNNADNRVEPGRQTCISMSLLGRTVPSLTLEKLSMSVVHMLKLDMTSIVISFWIGRLPFEKVTARRVPVRK